MIYRVYNLTDVTIEFDRCGIKREYDKIFVAPKRAILVEIPDLHAERLKKLYAGKLNIMQKGDN